MKRHTPHLALLLALLLAGFAPLPAAAHTDGHPSIHDTVAGIIVRLKRELTADQLIALTVPQSGEYINETTFLISPDALDKTQVTVWRGTPAQVAVFSDGLQMLALKLPEGTPHAPFFAPLFRFVAQMTDEVEAQEQLKAFLHSPRITERADDDLTLLLAAVV